VSRALRAWLLGGIAIAFVYLLAHAREPLRLSLGDPGADAEILSSVGVGDIAAFRLVAIAISALATWLVWSYVRRIYTDRVALIAAALFSTNLIWMTHADSLGQAPVLQATAFLALWGLVRAIETRQRRHYAAMIAGSFACAIASYDYYVFLPAAVLATIYLKAGPPFARGTRHLVVLGVLGCLVGIAVKGLGLIEIGGWNALAPDLHLPWLARAAPDHERSIMPEIPTLIRRITLVFTPLVWVTVGCNVGRAIRAPSLAAAQKGTAVWMLLAALPILYGFGPLAGSRMIASQGLLPFYAIGSALVLDRLLDGREPRRRFAVAWLVAAPLWSFYFLVTQPRSLLDRGDVAKTTAYLAANDANDFVLSNLMSDGPIRAVFQRHTWAALDADDAGDAPRKMMAIFELTGADYLHEVIFTEPSSRFLDRSLWPLAMPRTQWAITGWPHLYRAKASAMISEYDHRVEKNLEAVQAKQVLRLKNYAIYRVDRAAILAMLGDAVPTTNHVDFGSVHARRHELLGWDPPSLVGDGTPASLIRGVKRCLARPCKTTPANLGVVVPEATLPVAQVMIRVDPACDLQLTFTFTNPDYARFAINGFSAGPLFGKTATFTVPAAHLTTGINIVELEDQLPRALRAEQGVASLDLTPACPAP
jgi:hypothetical protein